MPHDLQPVDPLTSLIEGYQRFKHKHFQQSSTYDSLVVDGQQPKALVIACCDARVDPAIVTDCYPGELFVVRNVANLVPPFQCDPRHHGTSASVEFAVKSLAVKNIIVFGHSHCGGINAMMSAASAATTESSDFLHAWMDIAKPAKAQVEKLYADADFAMRCHHAEQASLVISLQNLMTFPWIRERVESDQLNLQAWYFDMQSGNVETYDETQARFILLDNLL